MPGHGKIRGGSCKIDYLHETDKGTPDEHYCKLKEPDHESDWAYVTVRFKNQSLPKYTFWVPLSPDIEVELSWWSTPLGGGPSGRDRGEEVRVQ